MKNINSSLAENSDFSMNLRAQRVEYIRSTFKCEELDNARIWCVSTIGSRMPVSVVTGCSERWNDPQNLVTKAEAADYLLANPDRFDALAWVSGFPYIGIDFDLRRIVGNQKEKVSWPSTECPPEDVMEILQSLGFPLIASSWGRHGFQAVLRGTLPEGHRTHFETDLSDYGIKLEIEVYSKPHAFRCGYPLTFRGAELVIPSEIRHCDIKGWYDGMINQLKQTGRYVELSPEQLAEIGIEPYDRDEFVDTYGAAGDFDAYDGENNCIITDFEALGVDVLEKDDPIFGDNQIINKALRSKAGPRFRDLFFKGYHPNHDYCNTDGEVKRYPSQNGADMSLVMTLIMCGAKNLETVDRIFVRSKLMREKWEKRQDYRIVTYKKGAALVEIGREEWLEEQEERRAEAEVILEQSRHTDLTPITACGPNVLGNVINLPVQPTSDCVPPEPRILLPRDITEEMTVDQVVQIFNSCCAVVKTMSNVDIAVLDLDDRNRPFVRHMNREGFNNLFANIWIKFDGKRHRASDIWWEHKKRREYDGYKMFLEDRWNGRYYNLWRGYGVDPIKGDCSLYLDHLLNVICSGNREYYDYLIKLMAQCVQDFEHKPGVSVILLGKEGTGKTMAIEYFGELFGSAYKYIIDANQIVGRFNSTLEDAIVVFADEAFFSGDKKSVDALKGTITGKTLPIERKGLDAYPAENLTHIFMATNHEHAIQITRDARRWFILRVSDEYSSENRSKDLEKAEYFKKIAEQMGNGGREALLYHLLNEVEVTMTEVMDPPKTTAFHDQVEMSRDSVEQFVQRLLDRGYLDDDYPGSWGVVAKDKLHSQYCAYCQMIRDNHPKSAAVFGRRLSEIFGGELKTSRPREHGERANLHVFPSVEVCSRRLNPSQFVVRDL